MRWLLKSPLGMWLIKLWFWSNCDVKSRFIFEWILKVLLKLHWPTITFIFLWLFDLLIFLLLLHLFFLCVIFYLRSHQYIGLNKLDTPMLYDLYFLPPQFCFVPKLVPVVWKKTEMVPPSNFRSKTIVQPRNPTGVGVHARHLSPWHTSALTWLLFFYYFNDFLYYNNNNNNIIKKKNWPRGWLNHPQGTISDTYSNHRGAHHEIYKTIGVYMGKKIVFK